jgi:HEAT repeat protein
MMDLENTTDTRTGPSAHAAPALVSALAARDGVERQCAREKLVSIGRPALSALVKCLADPNRQVRWEAAKALGELRDSAAATALVRALEDKDGDVRWLAASALAAIGHEALRPLLGALIQHSDSDWLRNGAHHVCHDLMNTSDGQLVKPVLDALNSSEPDIAAPVAAYAALRAL